MPADADADAAELTRAIVARLEMIEYRPRISIVARQLLLDLQRIPPIRAGLVIRIDRARLFKLMINLRHGDNKPMSREQPCGATDRAGDLEDLGIEQQPRIFA